MTAVDIIIREGKNRQIRRMFEGIGHDVRSITRVSHGPIRIKNLRPGEWRRLETVCVCVLDCQIVSVLLLGMDALGAIAAGVYSRVRR